MFTEVSSESCSTSTQKPGGVSQIPRIRYPRMRLSTTGCRDLIFFLCLCCLCFVRVYSSRSTLRSLQFSSRRFSYLAKISIAVVLMKN